RRRAPRMHRTHTRGRAGRAPWRSWLRKPAEPRQSSTGKREAPSWRTCYANGPTAARLGSSPVTPRQAPWPQRRPRWRRHNMSMTTATPIEPTPQVEAQALLLQLLDPANRADPYPVYAKCRERGPIQLPDANMTVFSTMNYCDEVLRHPSSASNRQTSTIAQRMLASGKWPQPAARRGFLVPAPPEPPRRRKLVSKASAPKVVSAVAPHIAAMVDELLDQIAERGRFDVIAALASPLPVAVICRLLGVPLQDEP